VTPSETDNDTPRDAVEETRTDRAPLEAQGAGPEEAWVGRLRKVCEDIAAPEKRTTRHTEGWEKWKPLIDLDVKDLRFYSPQFGKWTLAKVDKPDKTGKVRARGPFFGFGLTVEVENKSDQVLQGDNIYVWVTFKSKTGERVCFADSGASRSWNPFAKKGKGAWSKEKAFSEWPLRPREVKRYTVTRTSCFTQLFVETEPTEIKAEVYMRFRPLGSDTVIAGPLQTFDRAGALLRGAPLAGSAGIQKVKTKKGPIPARALYTAGDRVLVLGDKKSGWIPIDKLAGVTPDSPLKTEALPATTAPFEKTYGSLTVKIDNWRTSGWRKHAGKLKQGHKMLTGDVEISVDTSSITAALQAAVDSSAAVVAAAEADVAAKSAALVGAEAALQGAAGTEAEGAFKEAVKAAKGELKAAGKAVKVAQKGASAAAKALAGGVSKFLKTQAKSVNCGSFKVDVGRKNLKQAKSSTLNKKTCKPLLAGETVKGTINFDLERWDLPFMVSFQGAGKVLQSHRIASGALAKILKD